MDTLSFLTLHFPKSGGHPSRFLALLFLVVLYVIDGLNQTDPTPIAFSNHRFFTYYSYPGNYLFEILSGGNDDSAGQSSLVF